MNARRSKRFGGNRFWGPGTPVITCPVPGPPRNIMQPIQLSVFSETARLKQVVVHDPGPEVDQMVPGMMEKLLFDDILYGDLARHEHGQFRRVLATGADEVLDIQDRSIGRASY